MFQLLFNLLAGAVPAFELAPEAVDAAVAAAIAGVRVVNALSAVCVRTSRHGTAFRL